MDSKDNKLRGISPNESSRPSGEVLGVVQARQADLLNAEANMIQAVRSLGVQIGAPETATIAVPEQAAANYSYGEALYPTIPESESGQSVPTAASVEAAQPNVPIVGSSSSAQEAVIQDARNKIAAIHYGEGAISG